MNHRARTELLTDATTSADPGGATLVASGLEKMYFSTQPPTQVLVGVDLVVEDGEFVAVMGASGSGKSTLLYCASGMDRPTAGTVRLRGRELTSLSSKDMSRVRLTEMGFVFQHAYFLENLTVRDNVLLPAVKAASRDKRAVVSRVDGLLSRFGVGHVAHHGPSQVSGGQLQRAAICRALATEPSVLFADEPTGALNSSMTEDVMDALTDVHCGGTTIVMVTHDPGCAARADRVVYLRDGAVVDARALGRWEREQTQHREDDLLVWLKDHGF